MTRAERDRARDLARLARHLADRLTIAADPSTPDVDADATLAMAATHARNLTDGLADAVLMQWHD